MTMVEKPELAVNRDGRTVGEALNGFITHATTGFVGGAAIDIATAYFNVGGYSLLADALDQATGVRLLLGAEPEPPENRRRALRSEPVQSQRAARARMRLALDDQEQNLRFERNHLGFTAEVDAAARRLVNWLEAAGVEVRRLEGRFLHGKAFVVGDRLAWRRRGLVQFHLRRPCYQPRAEPRELRTARGCSGSGVVR